MKRPPARCTGPTRNGQRALANWHARAAPSYGTRWPRSLLRCRGRWEEVAPANGRREGFKKEARVAGGGRAPACPDRPPTPATPPSPAVKILSHYAAPNADIRRLGGRLQSSRHRFRRTMSKQVIPSQRTHSTFNNKSLNFTYRASTSRKHYFVLASSYVPA